jgi:uncharacterized protein YcaQ
MLKRLLLEIGMEQSEAFEAAYREIMEIARRQAADLAPAPPVANGGQCDWWEFSPHRTVTTDGSLPVTGAK